ncbi:GNAT family N-acetyltransferase [Lutibacter flavus]|uniref:Acetyltransferase (GNAT) domain-containing protein n=1 Tax=Lutibacter flavus TaxID=691689 RepID=A0A238Y2T1_9FLAO|nr:GNAT family N-acetyltransferase [Lutibacter flavus]SNR64629.1 Acetyltransferase (GNAT) domain-containing protein [Lutibacter flavus]
MVTIRKIKLKDLETFIKSNEYLSFEEKPISEARSISYLKNPNADDNDIVLYLGFKNNKLIGYKSIFADTFISNNSKVKFGWLSGTWTHQNFRRRGVSSLLFEEVYKDWRGRLMYTNYAKESKAVYDKTGKFELLNKLEGYRYYFRFCFKELLPPKSIFWKKNKNILGYLDNILNLIFDFRFKLFKVKRFSLYKFEKIEKLDIEIESFLKPYKKKELFQRDKKIFEWIINYPWIKTDSETKENSEQYHFSSYACSFETNWHKIYNRNTHKILGVALINARDKQLKIPYFYSNPEAILTLKNEILKLILSKKLNYITIYNQELNESLLNGKILKLKRKKFTQNYFVSKELLKEFPEIKNLSVQSGDGDVVFT